MGASLNVPLAESLDDALEVVATSINQRKWNQAAEQAANVTHHWPHSVRAWKQRYLVALLLNDLNGATTYSTHLKSLPGFNQVDLGDMLRDQVLAIVRNRETDQYDNARNMIVQITRLHKYDKNRDLCALAVYGRLLEAQGDYGGAFRNMMLAERGWAAMGKKANNQWRYNNWVHLQGLLAHPGKLSASRLNCTVYYVTSWYLGARLAAGLRGARWTPQHALTGLARPIPVLNRHIEHKLR